jgi:hypothetical protein
MSDEDDPIVRESFRLFRNANAAFYRGEVALVRGDMIAFAVARLEHSMIAAAHRELLNPGSQETA